MVQLRFGTLRPMGPLRFGTCIVQPFEMAAEHGSAALRNFIRASVAISTS
jgi:hypothetical protein